jgi:hypothetical protein
MDGLKPQKKKAKSPAPYPTNAGVNINGLRTGVLRTRTGFWNVQNFTSDLVKQGKKTTRELMSSARNEVRKEFIADVIIGMEFDSIVIMEMGSDAGQVLNSICDRLNRRDENFEWGADLSMDVGARQELPTNFAVDLSNWGDVEQRLWALPLVFRHWDCEVRYGELTIPALRDAILALAENQHESLPCLVQVDMDAADVDTLINAYNEDKRSMSEAHTAAIDALFRMNGGAAGSGPDLSVLADRMAAALMVIYSRGSVRAGARLQAFSSKLDGPFMALRILGVLHGRYEKYGILCRQPMTAKRVLHTLSRSEMWAAGSFANSRAPWQVDVPFGNIQSLSSNFIHSMWTPSRGAPDGFGAGRSAEDLRVDTLVEVARVADQQLVKPVFIAGDTNVKAKKVADLDRGMAPHGYSRKGGTPKTTLRTERTIRTLVDPTENDILNEPYDAVYVRTEWDNTRYQIEVNCPAWDERALFQAFIKQMETSVTVKTWYRDLLRDYFLPVRHRLEGRHAVITAGDPNTVLKAPGKDDTLEYLIAQQKNVAGITFRSDHNNLIAKLFSTLQPYSMRVFYLFFRKFISDHRLVCIDIANMDFDGDLFTKGASKPPKTWGKGASPAPAAPAAPELRAAMVAAHAPFGQVTCLQQNRNTCGLRAAANARHATLNATNGELTALATAYPAYGGGGVVDAGNFVDLADDQVDHMAKSTIWPIMGWVRRTTSR